MKLFPAVFIGHGSPMNFIQRNSFTESLRKLSGRLPKPRTILVISAHWLTQGTYVSTSPQLKTIYDFYGFPKELYEINYSPPSSLELAQVLMERGKGIPIVADGERGIEHGSISMRSYLLTNQAGGSD